MGRMPTASSANYCSGCRSPNRPPNKPNQRMAAARTPAAALRSDLGTLLATRHWASALRLFHRQPARSLLLGEVRSRFRGRGMEFAEVRIYQPGDDIRNIDWRVSARSGGTYTKLFCEERERPVHILVDQRNPMFFGSAGRFKSVLAAELAAALAWAALAGSDRIGGQIIGERAISDIRARRNKQTVLRFLHDLNAQCRALPEAPPADGEHKTLDAALEECRRLTRPGTAVFILSDFADFDAGAARTLGRLGRHTDLSLLRIRDPLESALPAAGSVAISDGAHKTLVGLNRRLCAAFRQELEVRQQHLLRAARRARAPLIDISTRDEPRTLLTRLYGKSLAATALPMRWQKLRHAS